MDLSVPQFVNKPRNANPIAGTSNLWSVLNLSQVIIQPEANQTLERVR